MTRGEVRWDGDWMGIGGREGHRRKGTSAGAEDHSHWIRGSVEARGTLEHGWVVSVCVCAAGMGGVRQQEGERGKRQWRDRAEPPASLLAFRAWRGGVHMGALDESVPRVGQSWERLEALVRGVRVASLFEAPSLHCVPS